MKTENTLSEVLKDIQQKLPQVYNMAELQFVADELGVDWEDLLGSTVEAKSYSLLLHMAITDNLEELHRELVWSRPMWDWPNLPKDYKQTAKTMLAEEPDSSPVKHEFDISKLRQQLVTYFDLSELQDLCLDLEINYEDLAGEGLSAKVRELLKYAQRHNRLDNVIAYCQEKRSFVTWGI